MNADIEHIAIADGIDLLLVAPCTANVIGKFANGIADDFLTSLYLATRAPVLLAPAMNTQHAGARGRAAEPPDAGGARRAVRRAGRGLSGLRLGRQGPAGRAGGRSSTAALRAARARRTSRCAGRRVLVTAGPTYEDIDPVRYVGNRSSGRMGFALAAEARRRGAQRDAGGRARRRSRRRPSSELVRVRSAAEMHEAVMRAAADADVVDHGRGRGRLHAGDAAAAEDRQERRPADADAASGRGTSWRTWARMRVAHGRRAARAGRLCRRDRRRRCASARDKRARKQRRPDRRQRRVARRPRASTWPTNAVTIVGDDGRSAVPLQSKARRRRRDPRPRRAAWCAPRRVAARSS